MENYIWLVLIPQLGVFFTIAATFVSISALLLGIGLFISYEDLDKKEIPYFIIWIKRIGIMSVFCWIVVVCLPDKNTVIQLKALSLLSDVKGLNTIPQKVIEKLDSLLKVENKKGED